MTEARSLVEWPQGHTAPDAVDRALDDPRPFDPCTCDWEVMTYRNKGEVRRRFLHETTECPRYATDWAGAGR